MIFKRSRGVQSPRKFKSL